MIEKIVGWLRAWLAKDLIDRTFELNNQLVEKTRDLNSCIVDKSELNDALEDSGKDRMELIDEINVYLKKPPLHKELYETLNVYKGERVYFTKNYNYKFTLPQIQDYFVCSRKLVDEKLKDCGVKTEWDYLKRFREIVYYTASHFQYYYDKHKFGNDIEENWEPIENLIVSKKGDCETVSMFVVMMMRASGVPSNRIFMADGLYTDDDKEYGHAFPVLWAEDDKWYVGEPTDHSVPIKTWESQRFNYVCLWGLGNDQYSVKIKGDKTFL